MPIQQSEEGIEKRPSTKFKSTSTFLALDVKQNAAYCHTSMELNCEFRVNYFPKSDLDGQIPPGNQKILL